MFGEFSAPPAPSASDEMNRLFAWPRAQQEKNSVGREVMKAASSLNEAMDNFAKDHPLAAKVGSVILEGAGYLTVGATLCTAAEGGVLPLLVSGSSMAASNEVVAAALEHGSEYVVREAAALGTTEAEAVQFGTAANGLINKFVLLGVVKATSKVVKGGKGTAKSLSASEAGAVSKEIFHQKQTAPVELQASISRGITEAVETNPLMKAQMARYKGGIYADLKKERVDGTELHHMPAGSVIQSRDKGTVIRTDIKDHMQTSSWGSSTEAKSYRAMLQKKVEEICEVQWQRIFGM
jgi:hypothetical protein